MEKESISSQILIPDEDIMEQSIKALYREIQTLRNTVQSQEEQLKAMAVELLLIGRWKPIDSTNQLLGFQNQCYVVANYDFVNRVSTGTSENPDMVDLKRQIYELFNRCFVPPYVNCCCETEIGLNTVLINTPNLRQQKSSVEEQRFLDRAADFINRAEAELQVQLKLVLSFCVPDLRKLPEAFDEVKRLRKLQDTFPQASRFLYAGRLELDRQYLEQSEEKLVSKLEQSITLRDITSAHRYFGSLAMLELQDRHDIEKQAASLAKRLEETHKQLGLTELMNGILLDAQTDIRNAHRVDELLLVLDQYFSRVDLFLRSYQEHQEQKQPLTTTIRTYIDANYSDSSLDLAKLASLLNVSENKISKAFKKDMGVGVLAYIQRCRIQKAEKLILETDMAVCDIVGCVGISSRRTFDRVFKQQTGMTAIQYRKSHGIPNSISR